ncbi:hypothetical protein D1BOALGB6SA_9521 [Olavius sp. associated proteobacterium Delta 1]|nr:hypothetical protein D1BOALGB6SA_9521 [Olavius sp. associated proteobacterium Delta 1]
MGIDTAAAPVCKETSRFELTGLVDAAALKGKVKRIAVIEIKINDKIPLNNFSPVAISASHRNKIWLSQLAIKMFYGMPISNFPANIASVNLFMPRNILRNFLPRFTEFYRVLQFREKNSEDDESR